MAFTSMMTIGNGAAAIAKKYLSQAKGRKEAKVAIRSTRVDKKSYMAVKLVTPREAHKKVIVVGLEAINAVLPLPTLHRPHAPPYWPPWL